MVIARMRKNMTGKQRGFTVIELMLVVVIMGIAGLYTIGFVKRMQRNNEVNKTVTQMQNIMKVALSYHSHYDRWPANANDLMQQYGLSNSDFCTVWPAATTSNLCNNRAEITMSEVSTPSGTLSSEQTVTQSDARLKTIFEVSLTMPKAQSNILQIIAASIPSAYLTNDNKTVTMYATSRITLPQEEKIYGYISGGGFVRNGDTVTLADECYGTLLANSSVSRKNMEKHLMLGFFSGLTDYKQWWERKGLLGTSTEYHRRMYSMTTQAKRSGDTVTLNALNEIITANLGYEFAPGGKGHDVKDPKLYSYYMSVCMPRGMWQAAFQVSISSGTLTNKSQRESRDVIEDYGQCSSTWVSSGNCNLGYGNNLYDAIFDN